MCSDIPHQRIIFIDWHGVISTTPFWASIISSITHPLRGQLRDKLSKVFSRTTYVHNWMRGAISSEDVTNDLEIRMDRRFRPDFLVRRLHADCARMKVDTELLKALVTVVGQVPIVLATDNMDCFAQVISSVRAKLNTRHPRKPELQDWASMFADVICSSNIGTLKAEDTHAFFNNVLSSRGLRFTDALLIDDRPDNCEAFRCCGGHALQWKTGLNRVSEAVEQTRFWINAK